LTIGILEELKAIGVEVIPTGDSLAIRPASKVPPELKERLRAHKAEVLAVLKSRPSTIPAKPTECKYDWQAHYNGQRLRCVVHRHAAGTDTVIVGHDTLASMLRLGVLTGSALTAAFVQSTGEGEMKPWVQ
jgi:TubC N-terminal docking domain